MRRSTRLISTLAAAGLLACAALPVGALGGTTSDQAVTLTYTVAHWTGQPRATMVGVDAAVGSPLFASGWFYRIDAESREHPLPAPDSETYSNGSVRATWQNLAGSGLSLEEVTEVFDTEGPSGSGGFVSTVTAVARTAPRTLTLFHYLDVNLNGQPGGDLATIVNPRFLKLSDGATRASYRADGAQHFQAALNGSLETSLNDANRTELLDIGSPIAGDQSAAYQFGPVGVAACAPACAPVKAMVSVFFNPPQDHVKGDLHGALGRSPLILEDPARRAAIVTWMRRTQAIALPEQLSSLEETIAPSATSRVSGVDDFDGNLQDELVFRDTASGVAFIGATPIAGAPVLPLTWKLSATGDFNHDGKADLLWRNTVSQKLVVWTMNGANKIGTITPNPDHAVDPNWEVAGAADFNGDGNRDLLWYNQTTGKIVMWYMDASLVRAQGLFTTPNGVGSNAWRVVAVGDYGRGPGGVYNTQDIVWQNDVSHKTVIWNMDQNATRTSGQFTAPDLIGGGLLVAGPR